MRAIDDVACSKPGVPFVKPLGLLPPIRVMENADVFGRVVVVAGLNAERHMVAFVEPEHKVLVRPAGAAWGSAGAAHSGYQKARSASNRRHFCRWRILLCRLQGCLL